jgi:predicted nucleic acid-binding protein
MIEVASPDRIYLDTNVFIRAFEEYPEAAQQLLALFAEFRRRPMTAVTSELTLAELIAPQQEKRGSPVSMKRRFYLDLIVWSGFVDLQPVSRAVLLETADLRQHASLKLPDAIHVVTAIRSKCRYFLSNDLGIKQLPQGMTCLRPIAPDIRMILEVLRA